MTTRVYTFCVWWMYICMNCRFEQFGFLLNTRGGVFEMEKSEDQQDGENVTIAPHFGDIMGKQTFTALPDGFMPIERIVLLANGNLQRVVSAFYNVSL